MKLPIPLSSVGLILSLTLILEWFSDSSLSNTKGISFSISCSCNDIFEVAITIFPAKSFSIKFLTVGIKYVSDFPKPHGPSNINTELSLSNAASSLIAASICPLRSL